MEAQLVRLLTETQSSQQEVRKTAELHLKQQYANPDFPIGLVSVGQHSDVAIEVRQSALLYLKTFVLACWSPAFDEFTGHLYTDEGRKAQIRQSLLGIALSEHDERKIKSAAGLVVSKVATADFPDAWPDLLPTVLNVVSNGSDGQLHGALKVLNELSMIVSTKSSSSRLPETLQDRSTTSPSLNTRGPFYAPWRSLSSGRHSTPWRW
jgi:hypothetical protein